MTIRACVVHGVRDLRVDVLPEAAPRDGEVAVDVALGGICGSDLHYYQHGSVGDFRIREPMVLGHEVVGHVVAAGDEAGAPAAGTPVAVHPATPCGECAECRSGHRNVCANTRYLGSAARMPHVQGGLGERIVVPAAQIRVLPPGLPLDRAVLAEPLAVALHAVRQAGEVEGRRVLVTGAGPIGLLVVTALRRAGAAEVIVSDLLEQPLRLAAGLGATATVRGDRPAEWPREAADVDVAIEASGSAGALSDCVRQVRRGGTVVLLGLLPPGEIGFLGNVVVTREISLRGSFRFDREFDDAIAHLAGGIEIGGVVSHSFPLDRARDAFDLAGDRTRAAKVLLDLTGRGKEPQ